MTRIFLALLCLGATCVASADPSLAPFSAKYRIYINKIPTPITAKLILEPAKGKGRYHMLFKANSWLLDNKEESWFTWNDCQPRTERYIHEFNGFGQHRYHHMSFSWSPPQATNESEDKKKTTFKIPADAMDDLSVLLRARCVFATGDKEYRATSVYGTRIRHSLFIVVARETIDTPMGKLDTLVVEKKRDKDKGDKRETLFWVAPKVGYMVVKARHVENAFLHGELIMTDYSGPKPE